MRISPTPSSCRLSRPHSLGPRCPGTTAAGSLCLLTARSASLCSNTASRRLGVLRTQSVRTARLEPVRG